MLFTPQQKCNNISDFSLIAFLSSFCEQDVQEFYCCKVNTGQIYCPTLLIPEMGKETFV